MATVNGHWTQTNFDGLGRTISVLKGDTGGTKSVVDTIYAPCGCSPLGKVSKVSQPYAPGGTVYYTTYGYDALGRTVSVQAPDGASTTSYSYWSNVVQVTDAAGNWKQYVSDALGNLTVVREPNPAAPSDRNQDFWTYYSYDVLGHLVQVQMPRGGTTQYRTFSYTDASGDVGPNLLSATNPENGTVTYTYNSDNTVSTRIDAKGQKVAYSYDSYGRPTQIRHYPDGTTEDTSQQVNLGYDSGGGPNTVGRLAFAKNPQVWEVYGYTPAGLLSSKQMTITIHGQPPIGGTGGTLSYTYTNEGQVASVSYPTVEIVDSHGIYVPAPGPVYNYSFDGMGRPAGLVEQDTSTTMVNNVQYGPAGEMLQMVDVPASLTHTFQYNNLLQLTRTTSKYSGTVRLDIQYSYSSTQNNGKITQSQDFVTGEQVNYQYDCLQRLVSAATTGSQWGLSFSYDGFGNRLSEQATKGTAPTVYATYDTATNRITGYTHDANGNIRHQPNGTWLSYDVENRIVSANANGTIETYAYAPDGQRVYRKSPDGTEYIFFYGVQGERIGPYVIGNGYLMTDARFGDPLVYFAGRRLGVNADRLGSNVSANSYYPYGEEERTSYGEDDVRFATYVRDGVTGLDYAVNRYYSSIIGRFLSPDPYTNHAGVSDPAAWNRYSYTRNDPANLFDPAGTEDCDPNDDRGYTACSPEIRTGSRPVIFRERKYNYPECNRPDTLKEERNLDFLVYHYADASAISKDSGINVSWLLGWAAEESGYGTSTIVANNGNYLNESVAPGGVTGGWLGALPCKEGTISGWACFTGFYASLYSALYTQHASGWLYPGLETPSAISVINSAITGNPNASEGEIFQAVADAGFSPVGTSTNEGYGSRIESVTKGVMRRLDCLLKNGYLQKE